MVIKDGAFSWCSESTTVILINRLEEIWRYALYQCRSLTRIVIPSTIRVIKDHTFSWYLGLMAAILNDGLEVQI